MMIIKDWRGDSLAHVKELGLSPGFYWIKSQGEEWQPAELETDGSLSVLGWDCPISSESVEFGARIERPEGT